MREYVTGPAGEILGSDHRDIIDMQTLDPAVPSMLYYGWIQTNGVAMVMPTSTRGFAQKTASYLRDFFRACGQGLWVRFWTATTGTSSTFRQSIPPAARSHASRLPSDAPCVVRGLVLRVEG